MASCRAVSSPPSRLHYRLSLAGGAPSAVTARIEVQYRARSAWASASGSPRI